MPLFAKFFCEFVWKLSSFDMRFIMNIVVIV